MKRTIPYDEQCHVKTQLANIKSYPIHNHPDLQVIYVLEGELSLKQFYTNSRMQPGSIHIVHSDDVHSMESITEDNLAIILYLDCDYFETIFPHLRNTVFVTHLDEVLYQDAFDLLKEQIFSIIAEDIDHSPGYTGRMNNTAVAMVNTLIKYFRGFSIDPSSKVYVHQTSHDFMQIDRVSRIMQYLYANYPFKVSLTEIAEQEQISAYYLSHVFQKLVGMNFRDFLSLIRVEMSEELLLSTDKSISQIAQTVGFSDTKYYTRHFYTHMGCHPKEYRRKYKYLTLEHVDPTVKEYPLEELVPVIGKYIQSPVFKSELTALPMITIDYQTDPIAVLNKPDIVLSPIRYIVNDFSRYLGSRDDLLDFYQNIVPNESIIELLQKMVQDPENFTLKTVEIFDSGKELNGVLTANGLRKPLFYFLEMLEGLPIDIISSSPAHIALKDKKQLSIIVFNTDLFERRTMDVVVRNIPGNCKLTQYTMNASKTGITYWSQLNFSKTLTERNVYEINLMSHPDISFELIPSGTQVFKSVELEPYDIIHFMFEL